MHEETVFIALGSNLGDREDYLRLGREALAEVMRIDKVSSIYQTPPWGVLDQPHYLNQVVKGRTSLRPLALLTFLKEKRTGDWAEGGHPLWPAGAGYGYFVLRSGNRGNGRTANPSSTLAGTSLCVGTPAGDCPGLGASRQWTECVGITSGLCGSGGDTAL
jgi:hypothetical protein